MPRKGIPPQCSAGAVKAPYGAKYGGFPSAPLRVPPHTKNACTCPTPSAPNGAATESGRKRCAVARQEDMTDNDYFQRENGGKVRQGATLRPALVRGRRQNNKKQCRESARKSRSFPFGKAGKAFSRAQNHPKPLQIVRRKSGCVRMLSKIFALSLLHTLPRVPAARPSPWVKRAFAGDCGILPASEREGRQA